MPLPALGAVAKFIAANGARAATVKHGKKAVDAAKKQIAKRQAAIDKAAKLKNDTTLGTTKRKMSKSAKELRQANKPPSSRQKVGKRKGPGIEGTKVRGADGKLRKIPTKRR